jgi:60 kDa SS-A/Ro ribonucleoprotein
MKFNKAQNLFENYPSATRNHEGALSYSMEPYLDLYTRVASNLVGESKFYQSGEDSDKELINSIHQMANIDPEFILQLAVYTRENLFLRSVTTLLLAEYANSKGVGKVPGARSYIKRCIKRPDDMTELVAYQLARNKQTGRKTKLPMAIKNGIGLAFPKFDNYQLAKYNRDDSVKLRDVMFLTHPKPQNEEQRLVWQKLIDNNLESPVTWEVMRSTGQMNWQQVLHNVFQKNGKTMNYMAIIRNLRNIITAKETTNDDIKFLAGLLKDENAIKYSKILPFRYLSAYIELRKLNPTDYFGKDITPIYESLEYATQKSIENIEKLPGTTVIAADTSGSMSWHTISPKSKVHPVNISTMLTMMARRICENSIVCRFDTDIKWLNLPDKSILPNSYAISTTGGATYAFLILRDLLHENITADRVMIFTDQEAYGCTRNGNFQKLWVDYNRTTHAKLYAIDLVGYGHSIMPDGMADTRIVGGWSENIFKMVTALEKGSNVINEIKNMEI